MHVLVKLFCLLMLALGLAYLNLSQIVWLSAVLVIAALLVDAHTLMSMIKRVRWILLVLAIMYAFSTPGEYIPSWKMPLRPTYEGVMLGLIQLLKMVMLLAALSIVIATTSRSVLIGGLYQLLLPLKCIRFNAEKFAVRIWLTLYYAEIRKETTYPSQKALNFKQLFALSESVAQNAVQDHIAIEVHPLKRRDYLQMVFVMLYVLTLGVA